MQTRIINPPTDQNNSRWIYKLAGISGILIGLGYIVITTAFVISGVPIPKEAEALLVYLSGKSTVWWTIIWLSMLTDILYIPFAFGIYQSLKNTYKNLLLSAVILYCLFVVLELATNWSIFPAILAIAQKYSVTSNDALRAVYIASAEYASGVINSPVNSFYNIFIPGLATTIFSWVMLKTSVFNKILAYVGIASGLLGMLSVIGGIFREPLSQLVIPASILVLFWKFFTGVKLMTLGRK